jgi:hypothetical protein
MESEDKTAPKRDPLEVLKGFGGVLPNKFIFATPPIYKEVYPNDRSKWPVFKVKPSDGLDFNHSIDRDDWYKLVDGKVIPIPGKVRMDKLKAGVKGWTNFKDGEEEIPFVPDTDGNLSDDGIRALKPELQGWLLGLIAGAESVSKEESDGLKF